MIGTATTFATPEDKTAARIASQLARGLRGDAAVDDTHPAFGELAAAGADAPTVAPRHRADDPDAAAAEAARLPGASGGSEGPLVSWIANCGCPATLEALFHRLRAVARRAEIVAHPRLDDDTRRALHREFAPHLHFTASREAYRTYTFEVAAALLADDRDDDEAARDWVAGLVATRALDAVADPDVRGEKLADVVAHLPDGPLVAASMVAKRRANVAENLPASAARRRVAADAAEVVAAVDAVGGAAASWRPAAAVFARTGGTVDEPWPQSVDGDDRVAARAVAELVEERWPVDAGLAAAAADVGVAAGLAGAKVSQFTSRAALVEAFLATGDALGGYLTEAEMAEVIDRMDDPAAAARWWPTSRADEAVALPARAWNAAAARARLIAWSGDPQLSAATRRAAAETLLASPADTGELDRADLRLARPSTLCAWLDRVPRRGVGDQLDAYQTVVAAGGRLPPERRARMLRLAGDTDEHPQQSADSVAALLRRGSAAPLDRDTARSMLADPDGAAAFARAIELTAARWAGSRLLDDGDRVGDAAELLVPHLPVGCGSGEPGWLEAELAARWLARQPLPDGSWVDLVRLAGDWDGTWGQLADTVAAVAAPG